MSGKNYKILHNFVGPFPQGRVVSDQDFMDFDKTVDIGRLQKLEAIEETDEERTLSPVPPGPENRSVLVTVTGDVLDEHGQDRPTAAAELGEKGRNAAMREAREQSGLNPDTAERESDPEGGEEDDEDRDLRERGGEMPKTTYSMGQTVPLGQTGGENYNEWRVAELREEAEKRGIEGTGSMNKAKLIAALSKHDAENE